MSFETALGISSDIDMGRSPKPAPNVTPHPWHWRVRRGLPPAGASGIDPGADPSSGKGLSYELHNEDASGRRHDRLCGWACSYESVRAGAGGPLPAHAARAETAGRA